MDKVPKTFLIGVTQPLLSGLVDYLTYTEQKGFIDDLEVWQDKDPHANCDDPLCLVSFYAKLCYKSLVLGKNTNVTRVRDIEDNLKSVFDSGHGSVYEHVWLNFVTTDCSRVFTHELVRHRVGTAFSQTSGRYVSIDNIEIVLPPDLRDQPVNFRYDNGETKLMTAQELVETEAYHLAGICRQLRDNLIKPGDSFATKKQITSAIRRLAPNGQTNEIGWSCNVRSLRHMLEMRTSRHAEWEIRVVFNEVANLIQQKWPLMLYGGVATEVDGLAEWTKLKL